MVLAPLLFLLFLRRFLSQSKLKEGEKGFGFPKKKGKRGSAKIVLPKVNFFERAKVCTWMGSKVKHKKDLKNLPTYVGPRLSFVQRLVWVWQSRLKRTTRIHLAKYLVPIYVPAFVWANFFSWKKKKKYIGQKLRGDSGEYCTWQKTPGFFASKKKSFVIS